MTKSADSMSLEEFKALIEKRNKDVLYPTKRKNVSGGQFVTAKASAALTMKRGYLKRQKP